MNIFMPVLLQKSALKGVHMDNYFRPVNFFTYFRDLKWKEDLEEVVNGNSSVITSPDRILDSQGTIPEDVLQRTTEGGPPLVCRDTCRDDMFGNKYVLGAIDMLEKFDKSVSILPYQTNEEYDVLLSRNVVFLNLIDAGAVNTVIECIVRNTPIILNRLPVMEDLLGTFYPLFYEELEDILAFKVQDLENAHYYLSNLNKYKFTDEHFLNSIVNSSIYYNI